MINLTEIEKISQRFNSATIQQLDSMKLLNRFDTKFILHADMLCDCMNEFAADYKIMEFNDKRIFKYNNQYFDTENYHFYSQHHNGKLNRTKVRFREYLDSGLCYFEIKQRANDGRTTKQRLLADHIENPINGSFGKLLKETINIKPEELLPQLIVTYDRMTLLNLENKEKITFDTNLSFSSNGNSIELPDLAIIEIKQKKMNYGADSVIRIKHYAERSTNRMSKYCIGLILTNNNIKYNRFKPKLLAINKLLGYKDERLFADRVVLV